MVTTSFQDWTEAVSASLLEVWQIIAMYVPVLFGGLLIFIVGLIVASGLGHLVERVLVATKVDSIVGRTGLDKEFERSGLRLSISRFFGRLTYWFFVIVTVLAVTDILFGSGTVSALVAPLLTYIPRVVAAVIILLGAVLLGSFLKGIIQASVMGAKLQAGKTLGSVAWWAIIITGIGAALIQLGIAVEIIQTLVTGVIAMLALAGGIAFGLGGKEYAAHLLSRFRDQMESKR
ncbi:MAG: hypothetical protein HYS87_00740 [Candidatus Colwellbacteria bacterium]|nr:hypothetical protein [Candidatus Colwellbacteria bacterium]